MLDGVNDHHNLTNDEEKYFEIKRKLFIIPELTIDFVSGFIAGEKRPC